VRVMLPGKRGAHAAMAYIMVCRDVWRPECRPIPVHARAVGSFSFDAVRYSGGLLRRKA